VVLGACKVSMVRMAPFAGAAAQDSRGKHHTAVHHCSSVAAHVHMSHDCTEANGFYHLALCFLPVVEHYLTHVLTINGLQRTANANQGAQNKSLIGLKTKRACGSVLAKAKIRPNFGKCDPHRVLYGST
jgi:hypothetical protein